MIAILLCLALAALVFSFGWGLLYAGLRAGDRPGDTAVTAIESHGRRGICLTVHNPGTQAVLLGASIRRHSLRLWCEGGAFVSVPRRTADEKLLAGKHGVVSIVPAGESQTMLIPLAALTRQRAELVLAVGEADRLRVIHRTVKRPQERQTAQQNPSRVTAAASRADAQDGVRG
ncbi:MAG TPA: hypothetical protein VG325_07020 [Solirubrobacteraceae bacterium]|nr:hypothetical protein [Solirubrobacteraceae bacterium]